MKYTQGIITSDDLTKNAESELFLDQQLACDSLCWTLSAQSMSADGTTTVETDSYSVLLLRGIITGEEPLEYSVNHHYSPIEDTVAGSVLGMAKTTFDEIKKYRVAADTISSGVSGLLSDNWGVNILGKDITVGDAKKFLSETKSSAENKLNDMTNGLFNKVNDITRGGLMMGTSKAKYYDGTDITINTPRIDFRYYHGMYRRADGHEVSVRELIQLLNNRLIGNYYGPDNAGNTIGVMGAPNGFLSTGIDIIGLNDNKIVPGTFCLEYSGRKIPNLICDDYQVKLSTTRLLDYSEDGLLESGTSRLGIRDANNELVTTGRRSRKGIDPLYADITISLSPVALYTRDNINQIMAI